MMVAWLLEDTLAELGCAVVGPAAGVKEALAMIDAKVIDVAVLDVNLNGEMSYPIADALVVRGVPFVFSTGYGKDRMPDGYQIFPVLQKPFHRAELTDIVTSDSTNRTTTATIRSTRTRTCRKRCAMWRARW